MNIILLRHGETDYNKLGISQSGDVDPIMNDQGIRQSELTGNFLSRNYNINKVYSSTLIRARQTAGVVSDIIGINSDSIIYNSKLKESSKKILEQFLLNKPSNPIDQKGRGIRY